MKINYKNRNLQLFKLGVIFSLIILIISCAPVRITTNPKLYDTSKKIGIIIVNDGISTFNYIEGKYIDSHGVDTKRFIEPLNVVSKRLNANSLFLQTYKIIFNKNNIEVKEIEGTLTFEYLDRFKKPKKTDKAYSIYDYQFIKEKFGVDRLIVAEVKYGLLLYKSGLIVVEKRGLCSISAEIIDLSDNSLLYKNESLAKILVEGKWNIPPDYDNLYYPIRKAIENSILIEKMNFNQKKKDITVITNE